MSCLSANRSLLSIMIVALILSATMFVQTSATIVTGNTVSKSITLTARADGRAFAMINDTYSYPSTQRIDYNNSFYLFTIDSKNEYGGTPKLYPGAGPRFTSLGPLTLGPLNPSGFEPTLLSTGAVSPSVKVPKFLMTDNVTNTVASPTITLSISSNITLALNKSSEFQVNAMNVVAVSLDVKAAQQDKLLAFTGRIAGDQAYVYLYDPGNNFVGYLISPAGYFAFPFLANKQGYYKAYLVSATSSYFNMTASVVPTTQLTIGQFTAGEMKIPEDINVDWQVKADSLPSQIVALSYDVSAGDEYGFTFSADEELAATFGTSQFYCMYFDVGKNVDGTTRWNTLATPATPVPWVSRAPVSGKVYLVLVANSPSRFQYSMGVQSSTVPTAPVNQPLYVELATSGGNNLRRMLYKFSINDNSIVRLNYTDYAGTIYAQIFKIGSDGTIYSTTEVTLNDAASWIILGLAKRNVGRLIKMDVGDYMLSFRTTGSNCHASVEINAYPIESYSSGTDINIGERVTKAYAINFTTPFEYQALNVTLRNYHTNISITYQISLFDDYLRQLGFSNQSAFNSNQYGIGTRKYDTGWRGIYVGNDTRRVYSSGNTARFFKLNHTDQVCQFVPTYAGTYYIILDLLEAFNTTRSGDAYPASAWQPLTAPGVQPLLQINVTSPNLLRIGELGGVSQIKYFALNSSLGSGSASVTFASAGGTVVSAGLKLIPEVNTWTSITVTIINGSVGSIINGTRGAGYYEYLLDRIRYDVRSPTYTFDYNNATPHIWPVLTYHMVHISGLLMNVSCTIEFGALSQEMMVEFFVGASSGAAHTEISVSVNHYSTPAFSGLTAVAAPPAAPPPPPAPSFPWEIGLIVGGIVAAALVVVFIVLRKRKPA